METRISISGWRSPWVPFVRIRRSVTCAPTTEEMLLALQKKLGVPWRRVSLLERKVKCLSGKPLRAEVERRTEAAIFRACYDRLMGPLQPYEEAFVQHDQRLYENEEFSDRLRVRRVRMGVVPYYVRDVYQKVCV